MKKLIFLSSFLLLSYFSSNSQTVTKSGNNTVNDAVCPAISTTYTVSRPSGFTSCQITWSASGGQISGPNNQPTVNVIWTDSPGTTGTVTATFSNCAKVDEGNNAKTASLSELILSVKNQAWGSYGSAVAVNYCGKTRVNLSVPRMYVQGTGGIGQPPLKEVAYSWTIPAGWREVGTGSTGNFVRIINAIAIEPIGCSLPGNVTVQGRINVPPIGCGSARPSATATIGLNGVSPVVTVGVPVGYTTKACDSSPVTFTPSINVVLGCVTNFTWQFPSGWSGPTSSIGPITLTPNGTGAMAGTIRATANTTCGSTISGTYTVTVRQPVINGPNPVCTNGNFTIQNTAANPTMSWSSSNANGLNINQATGAFTINSSFKGNITISASACGVSAAPKIVSVGSPSPLVDILKGSGTLAVGATVPFSILDPNNFGSTVPVSYNWDISGGYFSQVQGAEAYVTITDPYLILYASASNGCGQGSMISRSFSAEGGGCPPGEVCMARSFPNPANTSLTVTLDKDSKAKEAELKLLNRNLNEMFYLKTTEKEVVIPTSSLPEGIYYLNVLLGKERIQKQVVIKH
jgi:hypothetical protein